MDDIVSLLAVICYLALFRLDELGMAHYRRFIWAQDSNKMYKVNFTYTKSYRGNCKEREGQKPKYKYLNMSRQLISSV